MDNNKRPKNSESEQLSFNDPNAPSTTLPETLFLIDPSLQDQYLKNNNITDKRYWTSLFQKISPLVEPINDNLYSNSDIASTSYYNSPNKNLEAPIPLRNNRTETEKANFYNATENELGLLPMIPLNINNAEAINNQRRSRKQKANDYIVDINTCDKKFISLDFTIHIITRIAILLLLVAIITILMASIVIFAGGYLGVNASIYNFFNKIDTKIKSILHLIKTWIKLLFVHNSNQGFNSVNNSTYIPPANYTN
ncbi:hypothetical protein NEPAR04_0248 [Nematocida parisii]|nr:hypothetical protein NEPAR08_0242 [Nematocida parisii]KAI5126171.1 hypothetical protein NEPAR03_0343 [Nematocida parisii]KAI5140416.1 hypothetical protein NEPAR04_0248 [Nematocida parisii]